jgi:hypothetical protein
MKIALLCPTRKRPGDVVRLIRSIESTVQKFNNIKLYLGFDPDDETQHEVDDCIKFKSYITKVTFPKYDDFPGLGVLWNYMASQATEEIFAMVGDDFVYETPGWDAEIIEHFENGPEDNLLLVHCNDGLHGNGNKYTHTYGLSPGQFVAVNPFIHRKYYELNGYYLREEFKHQFVDTWLDSIYHVLKRKVYRHDIMIRHLHYTSTGVEDSVTLNLRQHSMYEGAKALYIQLKPERVEEVSRLERYIDESN